MNLRTHIQIWGPQANLRLQTLTMVISFPLGRSSELFFFPFFWTLGIRYKNLWKWYFCSLSFLNFSRSYIKLIPSKIETEFIPPYFLYLGLRDYKISYKILPSSFSSQFIISRDTAWAFEDFCSPFLRQGHGHSVNNSCSGSGFTVYKNTESSVEPPAPKVISVGVFQSITVLEMTHFSK